MKDREEKLDVPFKCPKCGEMIPVTIQDRMAPHRIARFLRKLGWVVLAINFPVFIYSLLTGRIYANGPGPNAGIAILAYIAGPSLALYGLSLFFPTVRIDQCCRCRFHRETTLWNETKIF